MQENHDTLESVAYKTSSIPGDRDHYLLMPIVKVKQDKVLPKHIHFLLDTSGSMENDRLAKAKSAIQDMVSTLNKDDTYSVIIFSSVTQVLIDKSNENTDIKKMLQFVRAGGGTNIVAAFAAIKRPKGIENRQQTIFLVTDGEDDSGVESPYQSIMEGLQKTFGHSLPTIVPVGIGQDFDRTLLNKLAERTHSTLISISDQTDSKIEFEKAAKFFQVRSEEVCFEINHSKIALGHCPYNTELSRVIKLPINKKNDFCQFKINDKTIKNQKIKKPEKNDYIVIAGWVNTEINQILQKITEIVAGVKITSSSSNGRENSAGVTIIVSSQNNYELDIQNQNEDNRDLIENRNNALENHLKKLNALIECLPNESPVLFVQATKNTACRLSTLIQNILHNSFHNEQNMKEELIICNNNVTQLVNLPNDGRTVLVEKQVKGGGQIKQTQYQKISSDINFAARIKLKNIISIDGGVTNRNAILLDVNSKKIDTLTQNIGRKLVEKQEVSKLLETISTGIHEALEGGSPNQHAHIENVQFDNRVIPSENLDAFIKDTQDNNESPIPFCRHHALLASEVIGRLIFSKKLPDDYIVHHRRGTAYNLKAHSFVTIENKDTYYLFDSTHPGVIYNLHDKKQKQEAIEYYKKQALDGLIEKDENATISPEVLSLISDKQNDHLNSVDMICPLSMELMLDPVTADGKIFYDRQYIVQWLQKNQNCPLTRKPIILKDLEKEENVEHAKQKLKEIKTWLHENVILPENAGMIKNKREIEKSEIEFKEKLAKFPNRVHEIEKEEEKKNAIILQKQLISAYRGYQNDNDMLWENFEEKNKKMLQEFDNILNFQEASVKGTNLLKNDQGVNNKSKNMTSNKSEEENKNNVRVNDSTGDDRDRSSNFSEASDKGTNPLKDDHDVNNNPKKSNGSNNVDYTIDELRKIPLFSIILCDRDRNRLCAILEKMDENDLLRQAVINETCTFLMSQDKQASAITFHQQAIETMQKHHPLARKLGIAMIVLGVMAVLAGAIMCAITLGAAIPVYAPLLGAGTTSLVSGVGIYRKSTELGRTMLDLELHSPSNN